MNKYQNEEKENTFWVQISAGQGPDECCMAVRLMLEAIRNESINRKISMKILEMLPGNFDNTFKSVLLSLDGEGAKEFISSIVGSILWICKSPYRPNHLRKNWFINVEVFREPGKMDFDEREVKIESMRSSGPGGQNVNKVESAVRVIHLPTGLIATAREERSQYMNKKLALARLAKLITVQNIERKNSLKTELWDQHTAITRGNPVRIYEGEKFKLKTKGRI